jgi:hypothetical protein
MKMIGRMAGAIIVNVVVLAGVMVLLPRVIPVMNKAADLAEDKIREIIRK